MWSYTQNLARYSLNDSAALSKRHPYFHWLFLFSIAHWFPTNELAGVVGFEPTNDGIKIRCLTAWRYPNILGSILVIMIKSHIQNKLLCEPINSYATIRRRWWVLRCTMGVEPTTNGTTSHRSANWATHTVAEVGFEPTYPSLWGKCVTKSTSFCNRGTEIRTLDLSVPNRAL